MAKSRPTQLNFSNQKRHQLSKRFLRVALIDTSKTSLANGTARYEGMPKSTMHIHVAMIHQQKQPNHARHVKHSNVCNKYEIVGKGHENRAKKMKKKWKICKPTGIR